jgi:CBS domain-containing protein
MSQTAGSGRGPTPRRGHSRATPLSEVMVREVISIQLDDKSSLVDTLMKHHPIHHLPVLEGRVLRGLIAQRDLYRSMLSALYYEDERELHSFLDNFTDVASIMTPDPLTLGPADTLGDALELMLQRKIGCVPVVDEQNRLLGILTDSDLLRILDDVLPE